MKVRLTYSVEFEEVPGEITKLLVKAQEQIRNCQLNLNNADYVPGTGLSLLERLDLSRKDLLDLDNNLESIGNIVLGYERALMEQRTPEEQGEESQSDQMPESGESDE